MNTLKKLIYSVVFLAIAACSCAHAQGKESIACRFGGVMCNCPKNVELEKAMVPQIIYTRTRQNFNISASMELSLFYDKDRITATLVFIPPEKETYGTISKEKPLKFIEQNEQGRAIFAQDFSVPFIDGLPDGTWQYIITVNCDGKEMTKRTGLFELKIHP